MNMIEMKATLVESLKEAAMANGCHGDYIKIIEMAQAGQLNPKDVFGVGWQELISCHYWEFPLEIRMRLFQ